MLYYITFLNFNNNNNNNNNRIYIGNTSKGFDCSNIGHIIQHITTMSFEGTFTLFTG